MIMSYKKSVHQKKKNIAGLLLNVSYVRTYSLSVCEMYFFCELVDMCCSALLIFFRVDKTATEKVHFCMDSISPASVFYYFCVIFRV